MKWVRADFEPTYPEFVELLQSLPRDFFTGSPETVCLYQIDFAEFLIPRFFQNFLQPFPIQKWFTAGDVDFCAIAGEDFQ
jgi:hypothetical protein